jgi:hypothetical protein
MTHISAAGESDSAENDSCDSPLEPNSPLYGVSERLDPESLKTVIFFLWLNYIFATFIVSQKLYCPLILI